MAIHYIVFLHSQFIKTELPQYDKDGLIVPEECDFFEDDDQELADLEDGYGDDEEDRVRADTYIKWLLEPSKPYYRNKYNVLSEETKEAR